jgi:hypothetical protein
MVVLAFLTDPAVLRRILTHLSLPTAPPPLAPARSSATDFEPVPEPAVDQSASDDADHESQAQASRRGRGPP